MKWTQCLNSRNRYSVKGERIFTAPISAVTQDQAWSLESNLDLSQKKFLKPKPKKTR
jgi:hypothetical protein